MHGLISIMGYHTATNEHVGRSQAAMTRTRTAYSVASVIDAWTQAA